MPRRGGPTPDRNRVVTALPAPTDDARLVARALDRDRWAGEALFRRRAPHTVRVATLLRGRTADADDVVQDALVQALRELDTLRDPASFGARVARIAGSLSRSRLHRRALFRRLGLDRRDEETSLDELAAEHVRSDEHAALARVSVAPRKRPPIAWTLRRVKGWSLAEIGEAVGASLATVERRLAAADAVSSGQVGGALTSEEEER